MTCMLKIKNLQVFHGYVQAVRDLSLEVQKGELLAILGANGAGKSTLLGAIVGLYRPSGGQIIMEGKDITGQGTVYAVWQGISLVPECREIFGTLSVWDNLLLGAFHRRRCGKTEILKDAKEILDIFPALKGRERDMAGSLSGGLQQMLAIGRGLMARPQLLMLDEPSIGLAPMVVREIMSTLLQLKKSGITIVLVEQNTRVALKAADRALVMEKGQFILEGSSGQLLNDSAVCQAYLGRSSIKPVVAI